MKYLKLFEDVSDRETLYDIIEEILSLDLEPSEIENYISIKTDFDIMKMMSELLIIKTDAGFITDLMNVENGIINHMTNISNGNYCVDADYSELDYMHHYLNIENMQVIRDIANWLDWDYPEESKGKDGEDVLYGETKDMFEYLGLDNMLNEMLSEISVMKSESTKKYVQKILEESPISIDKAYISWNNKEYQYDSILTIDYKKTLEFLDKHKLKDNVLSIANLLLSIGRILDYSFDIEFNSSGFDADIDADRIFENGLFDYWDIKEKKPEQRMFLKLIQNNHTDDIKERFNDIDWNDKIEDKKTKDGYHYLVEYSNKKSDLYDWFASDEFIEKMESKNVDKELLEYLYELKLKVFGEDLGLF
ncbi:hypothetical protein M0Q50_07680 [bacterium]|jgi:hypothetical protein|nr:hypothetical protein [bacterium]